MQWTFGLLRYNLASQKLLDVWAYEAYRLFADRLVNRESQMKFEVVVSVWLTALSDCCYCLPFQSILSGILRTPWNHELKLSDLYYTSLHALTSVAAPAAAAAAANNSGKEKKGADKVRD